MRSLRIAALLALAAVAAPVAIASAAGNDTARRNHISFTERNTYRPGYTTGLSASFFSVGSWAPVKSSSKSHRSFHAGGSSCRYSITVSTRLVADGAETPAEHVTAALPVPAAAYLLDYGTRGTASAWRVTRLKTTGGVVKLSAMRADHRSLGGGGKGWQETIVSAVSRAGSECHSGTYRATLGPQIGDLLATETGRVYVIQTSKLS